MERRYDHLDIQQATFMMLETDPKRPGFGWAPPRYQNSVGSVLVTRQDRSPLQPMDVEIMAEFCMACMQPIFEEYLESSSSDPGIVLAAMTPQRYQEFCIEYREMQAAYAQDADEAAA